MERSGTYKFGEGGDRCAGGVGAAGILARSNVVKNANCSEVGRPRAKKISGILRKCVRGSSDLPAQRLCRLNHDFQLLGRELPADRHEAAIGGQPNLIGRQILKHPRNTALH